jgi:hypothetical protein
MIDLPRQQQVHHLEQTHLDGVGVLEQLQRYFPALLLDIGVDLQLLLAVLVVEVAESAGMHGWGGALGSVDFDVLTASNGFRV